MQLNPNADTSPAQARPRCLGASTAPTVMQPKAMHTKAMHPKEPGLGQAMFHAPLPPLPRGRGEAGIALHHRHRHSISSQPGETPAASR